MEKLSSGGAKLYIGLSRSKQNAANKRFLLRIIKGWSAQCFWCKKDCYLSHTGKELGHNHATADHLYSKLDIRRCIAQEREEYMRVSCWECNQKRDKEQRSSIFNYPSETVNLIELLTHDTAQ